jgi:hypothetical protein
LRGTFYSIAIRICGIGAQLGILVWVKVLYSDLLDAFILALFLSTVGFNLTKAGSSFRVIRREADGGSGRRGLLEGGWIAVVMAICGVLITARIGKSGVPLASLAGIVIGATHGGLYKGFLNRRAFETYAFAFIGAAHYALVLCLLVVVDAKVVPVSGWAVVVSISTICGCLLIQRRKGALFAGELLYSYAYPFLFYYVGSTIVGASLWWYFITAKVIDTLSMLVGYWFQPFFHTGSYHARRTLISVLRRSVDWALFAAIFVWVAGLALIRSSEGWSEVASGVVTGTVISVSFLSVSFIAFGVVSMVRREWGVLAYAAALSFFPTAAFVLTEGILPLTGALGVALVIWLLHRVAALTVLTASQMEQKEEINPRDR